MTILFKKKNILHQIWPLYPNLPIGLKPSLEPVVPWSLSFCNPALALDAKRGGQVTKRKGGNPWMKKKKKFQKYSQIFTKTGFKIPNIFLIQKKYI